MQSVPLWVLGPGSWSKMAEKKTISRETLYPTPKQQTQRDQSGGFRAVCSAVRMSRASYEAYFTPSLSQGAHHSESSLSINGMPFFPALSHSKTVVRPNPKGSRVKGAVTAEWGAKGTKINGSTPARFCTVTRDLPTPPLCKFGTDCKVRDCKFRHIVSSAKSLPGRRSPAALGGRRATSNDRPGKVSSSRRRRLRRKRQREKWAAIARAEQAMRDAGVAGGQWVLAGAAPVGLPSEQRSRSSPVYARQRSLAILSGGSHNRSKSTSSASASRASKEGYLLPPLAGAPPAAIFDPKSGAMYMPVMQIAAPEQPRQVVDARGAVRFPAHATHMRSRSPPGRRHMPTHRGGQIRPSSGPAGVNCPILKPLFPIMPEFQRVWGTAREESTGWDHADSRATHSVRTASDPWALSTAAPISTTSSRRNSSAFAH